MSLIGRRLQVASGPSRSTFSHGRKLPQGGFQSVDGQYIAEDRCKLLPTGELPAHFGEGTQDVFADDMSTPVEDVTDQDVVFTSGQPDDDNSKKVSFDSETLTNDAKSPSDIQSAKSLSKLQTSNSNQDQHTKGPKLSTKGKVLLEEEYFDD